MAEDKPVPKSTKQVRYDDGRSTRHRQYVELIKTFSDDVGDTNAGQQVLLGLLELNLRAAQDQRDYWNLKKTTITEGRIDDAISKDYTKVCDMAIRLIREFYSLSGKKATKKRLAPIHEIIQGKK
jgi:hypothetical protein